MAKALLGHVPARSVDRRLLAEVAFLRGRVRELEGELERLHSADALAAGLADPSGAAARVRAEQPAMV
jgi:hypothetical protein